MNRLALVAIILAAPTAAAADPSPDATAGGFTAAVGGGVNVGTPFVEAQVGRRFKRASYLELYLDYSFDKAISEFSFQTFGAGVRTYLTRFDRFQPFHQAMAGFVVSSSGRFNNRAIGDRLLGPVFTQGLGVQVVMHQGWTAALVVSTGYPVWLRPELAVRYTF